ncbi:hypothetical protein GCM10010992_01650 [Cloacibacterium rupense]|uniref:Uncharacterized protein n=1 Tax=Cloacibacterium rupense TaxID=517423 RepID=A0ABQ2NEJ6_9FLAO|nr:hypothetical protein [Cloacibacterium rupense]GGP01406.1 hypothetical protein GCM10010992_01650 [Cloacibacterium rupense]
MKILISPVLILVFMMLLGFNDYNSKSETEKKEVLLLATQNFNDLIKINRTFKILSDSSYIFTELVKEENHSKSETFQGLVKIDNDTIKFSPFLLDFNISETAVLKNGFIEFIDGEYPERMKFEITKLNVNNNLDTQKFPNYAIFTFYKKFNKQEWQKEYSNYDLNNQELLKIDQIFKKEFSNNKRLETFDKYLKQIVAVRNNKNEILIQAHFFCKNTSLLESYQYYESMMNDGGNCNVYAELNLTTGKFNYFNIAGLA